MNYLSRLSDVIAARLGAIGTPVFLRAHFQLVSDHGHLTLLAAELIPLAERWLNGSVNRLHVQGSVRQGYLSFLLELTGGQTALINAGLLRSSEPALWLLIVGQGGTVRFDDQPEPSQLDAPIGSQKWISEIETARS